MKAFHVINIKFFITAFAKLKSENNPEIFFAEYENRLNQN